MIRAVIAHIREDWLLLADQISEIFPRGSREQVTELLIAFVRFWIAGGNFASFLNAGMLSGFDEPIADAVGKYGVDRELGDSAISSLTYSLLALTYGTVTLVTSDALDADIAITELRLRVGELLK